MLFFAGAAEGATIPATINDLFWRTEVTLTSTYAGGPSDCRTALKLIEGEAIPIQKLITHRFGLAKTQKGFEAVSTPMDYDCIKVIIEP